MVTETRTLEFERYYERSIPDALRSSETPATWPYGAEAWAEHRQAALAYLRSKCELDFCFQVAEKGWRPHELASGRPDMGAAMSNAGVAHRQISTVPRELQAAARNALQAVFASGASLDTVLQANLEQAAIGAWGGDDKAIRAAITAAEGAVNRKRAEVQAAAQAEAGKITVHIHRTFRWTGGQQAEPGTYLLTPDQVSELNNWRLRKEATARQHNWDHPEGDGRADLAWPPFTVEGPG